MEELLKHMEWVYVGLLLIAMVSFLVLLRFNAKNSQKAVICGKCQNTRECAGPQGKFCFLDNLDDSATDEIDCND